MSISKALRDLLESIQQEMLGAEFDLDWNRYKELEKKFHKAKELSKEILPLLERKHLLMVCSEINRQFNYVNPSYVRELDKLTGDIATKLASSGDVFNLLEK